MYHYFGKPGVQGRGGASSRTATPRMIRITTTTVQPPPGVLQGPQARSLEVSLCSRVCSTTRFTSTWVVGLSSSCISRRAEPRRPLVLFAALTLSSAEVFAQTCRIIRLRARRELDHDTQKGRRARRRHLHRRARRRFHPPGPARLCADARRFPERNEGRHREGYEP